MRSLPGTTGFRTQFLSTFVAETSSFLGSRLKRKEEQAGFCCGEPPGGGRGKKVLTRKKARRLRQSLNFQGGGIEGKKKGSEKAVRERQGISNNKPGSQASKVPVRERGYEETGGEPRKPHFRDTAKRRSHFPS